AGQLRLGMSSRATQERADAGQYLFEVKRLGDIVVGAGVESLDLVAPAVTRGEDQNQHSAPIATPRFQDRNAVHLRQTNVEYDGVVGLTVAEIVALLAIESAIDHISGVTQCGGELTIEIRIVLNNEQTHACLQR